MDEEKRRHFREAMLKADSQLKFRFDVHLATIRRMYGTLVAKDKTALRQWVAVLTEVRKAAPKTHLFSTLKLEFCEDMGEGHIETSSVPVGALHEALDYWDRGEDYAPDDLNKIVG